MDNSIKIFKNDVFGEVRVAGTSEEPLFCLADVCNAVELSNPSSVKTRLNDEDLQLLDLHALNPDLYVNGNSFATFITESAFYDVLLFSSSKKVKPYRRWVTHEILPSIRKTGEYSVKKALPKTYLEALKELVVVVEANEMLSLENKSMKPKAEYFDNLVDRNLLTNIRDTAKQIGIKEKDFVNYLLENKYMYRDKKKQLRPYAEHVPSLFQIKDYENNGHTGQQVLLTPKGKETFRLLVG
ncbi:phage repressor protein/antirepressor Ant [Phocaeicola sartorii]|uniref:Phage repressor protein/antirepressor Ant n=1 Tax=Phocaeicola sartorii TaxID=671267 RepID=A0A4S2FP66_9BACT|nr:phage antirepressor KilAC domain-containing protein [Phocaeicola sartorii]TGY70901.1 phage repressor protein/antirepressor Ant [Phocaeicola sartorii]